MANKLADGTYQTVCWHADDLKLSHADPKVNNKIIEKLWEKYETIEKGSMKVTRGKKHTYLGMLFDF